MNCHFDSIAVKFPPPPSNCSRRNSLSQLNHTCVTLTTAQLLDLHMDEILLIVDGNTVLNKLNKTAICSNVLCESDIYRMQTEIGYYEWKDKIKHLTLKLMLLNKRLF